MKKYVTIVKIMWQRALTYRFSVFAYRLGEILEVIILVMMWSAIYGGQTTIKGYTLREMITYILVGNIISVIVRNWMSGKVADEIRNGYLSVFLVKPINYFWDMFFREIGRISFALFISTFTQMFIAFLFINKLIINKDTSYILIIVLMVFFAFIIELLISYSIGLMAFWIDEVDGVFTSLDRLKKFLSGGYFPLTLLPAIYVKIGYALPFAYSFFVPTQLYLKKISLKEGFVGLLIQMIWIFLLYLLIKLIWSKGIKRYEGVGI
jgi:ABC-2 type transport system permease protein